MVEHCAISVTHDDPDLSADRTTSAVTPLVRGQSAARTTCSDTRDDRALSAARTTSAATRLLRDQSAARTTNSATQDGPDLAADLTTHTNSDHNVYVGISPGIL